MKEDEIVETLQQTKETIEAIAAAMKTIQDERFCCGGMQGLMDGCRTELQKAKELLDHTTAVWTILSDEL